MPLPSPPPSIATAAFDGRIKYFELLFKLLDESKGFAIMGDVANWYRCASLSFNMVQSYIGAEKAELSDRLAKVRTKIFLMDNRNFQSQTARLQYRNTVDRELLEIDGLLHSAARRLYLPMQESVEEIDIEALQRKVIRESGL